MPSHVAAEQAIVRLVYPREPNDYAAVGLQWPVWWLTHKTDAIDGAIQRELSAAQHIAEYVAGSPRRPSVMVYTPHDGCKRKLAPVLHRTIPVVSTKDVKVGDSCLVADVVVVFFAAVSNFQFVNGIDDVLTTVMGAARKGLIFISHTALCVYNGFQPFRECVTKFRSLKPKLSGTKAAIPGGCLGDQLPVCCYYHESSRFFSDGLQPIAGFCDVPCLSNFNNCTDKEHLCTDNCHGNSHGGCPYPCKLKLDCGHHCREHCGARCDCHIVGEFPLDCSHNVVVGYKNMEFEYKTVRHWFRGSCSAERKCRIIVPYICPQCDTETETECHLVAAQQAQCHFCEAERSKIESRVRRDLIQEHRREQATRKRQRETQLKDQHAASRRGVFVEGQRVAVVDDTCVRPPMPDVFPTGVYEALTKGESVVVIGCAVDPSDPVVTLYLVRSSTGAEVIVAGDGLSLVRALIDKKQDNLLMIADKAPARGSTDAGSLVVLLDATHAACPTGDPEITMADDIPAGTVCSVLSVELGTEEETELTVRCKMPFHPQIPFVVGSNKVRTILQPGDPLVMMDGKPQIFERALLAPLLLPRQLFSGVVRPGEQCKVVDVINAPPGGSSNGPFYVVELNSTPTAGKVAVLHVDSGELDEEYLIELEIERQILADITTRTEEMLTAAQDEEKISNYERARHKAQLLGDSAAPSDKMYSSDATAKDVSTTEFTKMQAERASRRKEAVSRAEHQRSAPVQKNRAEKDTKQLTAMLARQRESIEAYLHQEERDQRIRSSHKQEGFMPYGQPTGARGKPAPQQPGGQVAGSNHGPSRDSYHNAARTPAGKGDVRSAGSQPSQSPHQPLPGTPEYDAWVQQWNEYYRQCSEYQQQMAAYHEAQRRAGGK